VPDRVFLHIGPRKSGSTYLQSRLWANRAALRDRGIHLPGDGQIDHFRAGLDLRELPARGEQLPPVGRWDRLSAEVRASDARTVVISDERLAGLSFVQAARALRSLVPHAVHVIYAVREFAGLLPSEWQERIKQAMDAPFEAWLRQIATRGGPWFWRAHCLGNVLARWNVAPDHVHLVVVPPPGGDRDELWRRFASVIDAPPALPNGAARGNRSLGVAESEAVRRVYQHLERPRPPARIEQVMREVVSHQVLVPRRDVRPVRLPDACRSWIEHQTARRREFIESSGCRVVGDPDELAVDPARFAPDVVRPDDAEVLDAVVQVVGELTGRIARRRRRIRDRAGTTDAPPPAGAYLLHIGPPNERLAAAGRREIRRLLRRLDGADVQVAYVLLDVPSLLAGAWQRQARLQPTPPWPEWVTRLSEDDVTASRMWRAHDVGAVLDRWWECGADVIHVLVTPGSTTPLLDPATAEVVRRARERIGGDGPRRDLARVIDDLVVASAASDAPFPVPAGVRPWVEAQSAARRAGVADARYDVVGDLAALDVSDACFAPTVRPPSDSAALDAATRTAAALVGELAALRWGA
jgi:hypothetical protein